jgi:hypothetical protein
MTTGIHRLAALVFGAAILIAGLLHLGSKDYEFSPVENKSMLSTVAPPQPVIPTGQASQLLRVTGAAEPGNVEVGALLLNLLQPTEEPVLVFQIALNTHSVSLENIDIADQAYIENSEGTMIESGIRWQAEHNEGYHHIMGYLIVPEQDTEGSLIGEKVQWIKLVLRGIPKIERREFIWERTDKWG